MKQHTHTNHNNEYIDVEVELTREDYRWIAIGTSILICLFFVVIGCIVSWTPLCYTIGMFGFFWSYQLAFELSKTIRFNNMTTKGVLRAITYVCCIIMMCFSLMYEILVLFGQ